MQFGMPTLIENRSLEDNVALCRELGLQFIELNMNFPEYQTERLEKTDDLLRLAEQAESLLQSKVVGVALVENKLRNMRCRKWKIYLVQHI